MDALRAKPGKFARSVVVVAFVAALVSVQPPRARAEEPIADYRLEGAIIAAAQAIKNERRSSGVPPVVCVELETNPEAGESERLPDLSPDIIDRIQKESHRETVVKPASACMGIRRWLTGTHAWKLECFEIDVELASSYRGAGKKFDLPARDNWNENRRASLLLDVAPRALDIDEVPSAVKDGEFTYDYTCFASFPGRGLEFYHVDLETDDGAVSARAWTFTIGGIIFD